MPCFVCHKNNLISFLDMGFQPPSDSFLKKEDLKKPEISYPLELFLCLSCYLVQLSYIVPPEKLFKGFIYTTGANNSLKKNFKELANTLVQSFELKHSDLVIDIGSNDGTFLSNFLPHRIKILGVDPAVIVAKIARKNKVPTVVDFFSSKLARTISRKHGKAKIIVATNVFAHIDNLDDFVLGIKNLLTPDGVFVSESNYLLDFIQKLQYDSVYHEHLRYYSLLPLQILFKRFGLEIFDVERISTHGGSIRVYAAIRGSYSISTHVKQLLALEKKSELYNIKTYLGFAQKVYKNKLEIQKFLVEQKSRGKMIIGIGAPAKGNTLINFCNLDLGLIDYLVEKNELKINTFTPGAHIPIVAENKLFKDQSDFALMLSWNIVDELIPKLRGLGYRGKFIIPTPKLKII